MPIPIRRNPAEEEQPQNESEKQPQEESEKQPQEESPQKNLARPSAEDIYQQVATNARQELKRSNLSLAISGFGGGAFMGLSAMGTAIAVALIGDSPHAHMISRMFYSL